MPRYCAEEAVARGLPDYDRARADRLIKWLDKCGYSIAEKAEPSSSSAPTSRSKIERERDLA